MKTRTGFAFILIAIVSLSLAVPDLLLGKTKSAPDSGAVATEFSIDEGGIKIKTKGNALHGEEGEVSIEIGEGHDVVRIGHSIIVPRGKKIRGSVVSIGGSISVFGEVLGDAVSIGGTVNVDSGGIVNGDAVSIGGSVMEGIGGNIRGENVSLGFLPSAMLKGGGAKWICGFLPFVSDAACFIGPGWVIGTRLAKLFVFLLFGAVMVLLFRDRIGRIASTFSSRFVQSFAVGFTIMILLLPIFLITFILLCISIIGIPLAIAYPFIVMVLLFIGYVAGALVIGRRVRPGLGPVQAALLGIFLIHLIGIVGALISLPGGFLWGLGFSIRILGIVVGAFVTTAGIGAVALSKLGKAEKRTEEKDPAQAVTV
ncbi:MAG: hypothetical protein QME66_02950 [Candidatus Eisenbacteria bacterium]|nr:hypothetical protein [Candidatus Eisenbacteria bacterium]